MALAEYQSYASRRKRLRPANRDNRNYTVFTDSESERELARFDSEFESPRGKRRRTLQILSTKATRRETRSSRSTRGLLSLGNIYREDESDITFSDSSARQGSRRS